MSGHPWHKRYHSDALTGYSGLNLELRGAYSTILDLLYHEGEPGLPDNERLMAGYMGVSTRRWRIIREDLLAAKKIEIDEDGLITNRRYLKERGKQKTLSQTRAEAGSRGGIAKARNEQQNLPLEAAQPAETLEQPEAFARDLPVERDQGQKQGAQASSHIENDAKTTRTDEFSSDFQTREFDEFPAEPAETLEQPLANAQQNSSYTRANPDTISQSLTTPTSSSNAAKDDDENRLPDLMSRTETIARKAGVNLVNPGNLAKAMDQLKQWLDEGIDFDTAILPTIEAKTRRDPSPVFSLKYFDAEVRKAHAVSDVNRGQPAPRKPIVKPPIDAQDDGDERVATFRRQVKYALGDDRYAARYSPEHVACSVVDERFLRVLFRDDRDEDFCRTGVDSFELGRIASRLGLQLDLRVKRG